MALLFAQVQEQIDSSGLGGVLTSQLGNLSSAGGLLASLADNPPAALGQMITSLQGLSLPQIGPLQDLAGQMDRLGKLVPSDSGELTGALSGGLNKILEAAGGDALEPFTKAVALVQALAEAIESGAASGGASTLLAKPPAAGLQLLVAHRPPSGAALAAPSPSPLATGLAKISQALDTLPSPLTVESLFGWLLDRLNEFPVEVFPTGRVPGISDLRQVLETTLRWKSLDATSLTAELQTSLQALASFIGQPITAETQQTIASIQALSAAANLAPLGAALQGLDHEMRSLTSEIGAGNLGGVATRVAALNGNLGQLNSSLAALQSSVLGGQADALSGKLRALPDLLDGQMRSILAVISPPAAGAPSDALAGLDQLIPQAQIDALAAEVRSVLDWMVSLIDGINFDALRAPLTAVIGGIKSTVAQLDDLVVELTTTITLLFDEVDSFVDSLDVASVTGAVQNALTTIRATIVDQINALFAPARDALNSAVGALQAAAQAFDVEAIIAPLRNAIHGIAAVLKDVEGTVFTPVKNALDSAAQALERLSFQPVTDTVIAEIGKVTDALQQIDPNAIPAPLRDALSSAVAVLPRDFTPIADQITSRLDELIDQGPMPILTGLKDQPAKLADQIQGVSPANLIGDQLSGPYQEFVGRLDAFTPSDLLKPVQDALDELKQRLQALNPAELLAPLAKLHEQLLAAFDQIKPGELLRPIAAQVGQVIDKVVGLLPLDTIFGQIDKVLSTIDRVVGSVDAFRSLLEKLTGLLDGLDTPDQQVRQLVDSVLSVVDQIGDIGPLQAAFAAVRAAVQAVRGDQLQPLLSAPLSALVGQIDALGPGSMQTALVRARRDLAQAASGLPVSPERSQIESFLAGFDPLSTAIARPLRALQTLRDTLDEQRAALVAFFAQWDSLYHQAQGPFAEYQSDLTIDQLRGILREAIEPVVTRPLTRLLLVVNRASLLLKAVFGEVRRFSDAIQTRLASLLLIPEAAHAIRDALNEVVTAIRAFDLSFVADQVQTTFDLVRGKLAALDPAAIQAAVAATFDEVIGTLSVEALLPHAEIAAIDDAYQQVVDKLRAVDPTKLIVETVQPEFDDVVKPLIELLTSLSALMQALVTRLDGLADELNQALTETGEAFSEMVAAIPV